MAIRTHPTYTSAISPVAGIITGTPDEIARIRREYNKEFSRL